MDRLAFLARELYDEFDPDSPNYWARESPLSATLDEINQEFRRNRRSIIKAREFIGGSLVSKEYLRLDKLLTSIITDPFIPHVVRAKVVEFLQNRINTIEEVHSNEIDKYRSELAKGLVKGRLSEYKNVVHNRVVDSLGERGFGVSQVEQSVNQIRLEIQKYFESFDPLR
jgi:hypothetical protein